MESCQPGPPEERRPPICPENLVKGGLFGFRRHLEKLRFWKGEEGPSKSVLHLATKYIKVIHRSETFTLAMLNTVFLFCASRKQQGRKGALSDKGSGMCEPRHMLCGM